MMLYCTVCLKTTQFIPENIKELTPDGLDYGGAYVKYVTAYCCSECGMRHKVRFVKGIGAGSDGLVRKPTIEISS